MIQIHSDQPPKFAGKSLKEASSAMILVHGRGASAESILDLAQHLPHPDMAYLAPQASNNTWYPYSFLQALENNQPGLDGGLAAIERLVKMIEEVGGISAENIIIGGFSQGACLASEFVVRNPRRYGGLLTFSGGVIGPIGMARSDSGDLAGTPAFIGCSDVDFHIPVERVHETADILSTLGATVNKQIYPGMAHTIIPDELEHANRVVQSLNS